MTTSPFQTESLPDYQWDGLERHTGVSREELTKVFSKIHYHHCPGAFVDVPGADPVKHTGRARTRNDDGTWTEETFEYEKVPQVWDPTADKGPSWKHLVGLALTADEVALVSQIFSYFHGSDPGMGQWVKDRADGLFDLESLYMCEGGPDEQCFTPWDWCRTSVLFDRSKRMDKWLVQWQTQNGFPYNLNIGMVNGKSRYTLNV